MRMQCGARLHLVLHVHLPHSETFCFFLASRSASSSRMRARRRKASSSSEAGGARTARLGARSCVSGGAARSEGATSCD